MNPLFHLLTDESMRSTPNPLTNKTINRKGMTKNGIYIYGIVPNFYSTEMFRSLDNSGVYAIPFENISAIVSDRNGTAIDYSDRESLGNLLVHHQKTIEELQSRGFSIVLPVRLGTIVNSKEDIFKIFANGYDLITETLKKTQFLTEINIAVTWADFSKVLKEVAEDPEIILLKEKILNNSKNLSQESQMNMGMLVQSKLKEKNVKAESDILDFLSPVSLDIKIHDVMNDQMILNAAFLIEKNKQEEFEMIIDRLDEEYKGLLNFKLIGPLPCYSFYTIEVKKLNAEEVAMAYKELCLNEETSESEIKKAYLNRAKLFHPDANIKNGDEDGFNRITKAYHTLLDYSVAARQSSKEELISLAKEKVNENLILVKIKE